MELIESCVLYTLTKNNFLFITNAHLVTYEHICRCCEGMDVLRSTGKATEGILVAFQAKEKP